MIRLILIFVLLAFTPVWSIAQSVDFNSQKEKGLKSTVSILEDKSGVKTLDDILAMQDSFKPAKHVFSGGFTQSAYWFRIVVQREAIAAEDWVLSVKPVTANDLRFYSLNDTNQYEMQQVGSLFIASVRAIDQQLGGYSFRLSLNNTTPHIFYVRLKSRSTVQLKVSINTAAEISQQNKNRKLLLAVLFGALLMVAINILLMWQQVNYKFYIAFIGYIIASIINIMMVEGGFIEVWLLNYPQLSSVLVDISFCSFVIFKSLFFIYYFDTKKYYPVTHTFFLIFMGIVFLTILATPFDLFTLIAPSVVILMIIVTAIQLYIAWLSGRSNSSEACYVFFAFALYLIIFLITLLAVSGAMWVDPVGILSARIILFVVFMFIGLHKNFQNLQRKQQETKREKENAENLVEEEKRHSVERSNFLNLIAHEIKMPLATIDSAIQVIQTYNKNDSKMIQERYYRVRVSVRQLNNLLENILTAERDEQLPFYAESKPVALKKLIKRVLAEQVTVQQKCIINIQDDLECRADRGLLGLALSNLLKNAIKYSPQHSTINCYAQKATGGVFFSISNSYLSEQEPDTEQWFKKYYKETKETGGSSLGLGLFLVKRIIKAHEGEIDCEISQEKGGWRVAMNVWLPDNARESK